MMNQEKQQVLALAATVQALSAVHDVASEGYFHHERATAVLQALLNYSPEDVLSAYGGNASHLHHGIGELKKLFGESLNRDISQYLLAVISIELKLVRNAHMRQLLQSELQRLTHQVNNQIAETTESETFETISSNPYTNTETISAFATLYKQTASQTEPRIMVKGNHTFLQQEKSANQIRALLLAALRGAAFFRHYGGKRFDLMIKRNQYLDLLETF